MTDFENILAHLTMMNERMTDIGEHIAGDGFECVFDLCEVKNEFGGNPEYVVMFNYKTSGFAGREKRWTWHLASQTFEGFMNEVQAYMFDVIDGLCALC